MRAGLRNRKFNYHGLKKEKRPLWDSNLSPLSPSRAYTLPVLPLGSCPKGGHRVKVNQKRLFVGLTGRCGFALHKILHPSSLHCQCEAIRNAPITMRAFTVIRHKEETLVVPDGCYHREMINKAVWPPGNMKHALQIYVSNKHPC